MKNTHRIITSVQVYNLSWYVLKYIYMCVCVCVCVLVVVVVVVVVHVICTCIKSRDEKMSKNSRTKSCTKQSNIFFFFCINVCAMQEPRIKHQTEIHVL
ncbi:hypothetical protein ACB092_02G101900 [Castanea dentata]